MLRSSVILCRRIIRFDIQERRLYIDNRHIHHFWIGLIWALSDYRDYRDWIPDLLRRS